MDVSRFYKSWIGPDDRPFRRGGVKVSTSKVPLKPMLETTITLIQTQLSHLDLYAAKLSGRDEKMFNRVVAYLQKHNPQRATMVANELVELRKIEKMVTTTKLALERIVLRIGTIKELGDLTVTLASAVSAVKSVRASVSEIVPEAERGFGDFAETLSSLLVEAGQLSGSTLDFEAANQNAERILREASAVAEQKLKEKFPELPADIERRVFEPIEA